MRFLKQSRLQRQKVEQSWESLGSGKKGKLIFSEHKVPVLQDKEF